MISDEHKQAVREGRVEPTKADGDWISEELNAMMAEADPLQKLKEKLGSGTVTQ